MYCISFTFLDTPYKMHSLTGSLETCLTLFYFLKEIPELLYDMYIFDISNGVFKETLFPRKGISAYSSEKKASYREKRNPERQNLQSEEDWRCRTYIACQCGEPCLG